jgi:hypothetical protein
MYSIIIQVYKFGIRRTDRELANDPGLPGVLSLVHFDHHPVLRLSKIGDNSGSNKVLPPLFEPRCLGWGGELMTWRGYQKPWMKNSHDQAPVCIQEWRVRLIDQRELDRLYAK